MPLVEIDYHPTVRQLRLFAIVWLPLGLGIATVIARYTLEGPTAVVIGSLAAVSISVGLVRPTWGAPVFVAVSLLTYPIGLVVSFALLAGIYFLVITPIAMLMRLLGRDPLERRIDRSAETYWRPCEPSSDIAHYFRQF